MDYSKAFFITIYFAIYYSLKIFSLRTYRKIDLVSLFASAVFPFLSALFIYVESIVWLILIAFLDSAVFYIKCESINYRNSMLKKHAYELAIVVFVALIILAYIFFQLANG